MTLPNSNLGPCVLNYTLYYTLFLIFGSSAPYSFLTHL